MTSKFEIFLENMMIDELAGTVNEKNTISKDHPQYTLYKYLMSS